MSSSISPPAVRTCIPSDYYVFQAAADPFGTFSAPILYQGSTGYFNSGNGSCAQRWGTYSTAIADPNNPHAFWISNEYVASNWWQTSVAQVEIHPDTTAPAAPTGLSLDTTTDSGAQGDRITSFTQVKIDGTAETGSTVTLYDTNGTTVLGTGTANLTTGAFSITTSTLQDGTHSITARATDAAGNTSTASAAFAVTADTTAPTGGAPDLIAACDTGSSSTDNLTKQTAPTFQVALDPTVQVGDTVELKLGGGSLTHPVLHTITAGDVAAGSVQLAVTAGDLGANGAKLFTAVFADAAGNTSSTSALSITLDTAAPTGGTPDLIAVSDTGSSSTDNLTTQTAPTFQVALDPTVQAGDTVELKLGGGSLTHPVLHTITAGDVAAGTVQLAVSAGDLGADGSKSFTAVFADAAGNTSTTSALSITLDTTIATPTVALSNDTGSSASDNITQDAALTFSAPAADVSRTYTVDGGTPSASYTAPAADGSHTVVVSDTDTAGNTANASISFTLDTTIATPTVALSSDTGSSTSDNITQDAALSFSTAAADVSRTYTVDGGTPAASYTAPAADGSHTVVVSDTDTAGNTANASISFTLDTTIATPTVALTNDTGSSTSDNITQDAALTFSTAAADVSRTYTVDGGTPSASYTAPAADGGHTVVVTDTDTAGNTANASISFTLDTTIATPTVALSQRHRQLDQRQHHPGRGADLQHGGRRRQPHLHGRRRDAVGELHRAGGGRQPHRGGQRHRHRRQHRQCQHQFYARHHHRDPDGGADQRHRQLRPATTSPRTPALTFSTAAADVSRTYTVDGGTPSASYTAPAADGSHTRRGDRHRHRRQHRQRQHQLHARHHDRDPDGGADQRHRQLRPATTSPRTPALTFSTAAADVSRTYTVDGGTPSASYTAPAADGSHTVVVTDTDTAGNTANASISFTLDTTDRDPDGGADQRHRQLGQRQHHPGRGADLQHGGRRRQPHLHGRRRDAVGELHRAGGGRQPHRGGDRHRHRRQHRQRQHQLHARHHHRDPDGGAEQRHRQLDQRQHHPGRRR